jgi:hypothetical protein
VHPELIHASKGYIYFLIHATKGYIYAGYMYDKFMRNKKMV